VIVVGHSARVRGVLAPVYAAMGLPFAPETAGAVEDEAPGVTRVDVAEALLAELRARGFAPEPAPPAALAALLPRARELAPRFEAPAGGADGAPPAGKIAFEALDATDGPAGRRDVAPEH
jgi:hypothetical protein